MTAPADLSTNALPSAAPAAPGGAPLLLYLLSLRLLP